MAVKFHDVGLTSVLRASPPRQAPPGDHSCRSPEALSDCKKKNKHSRHATSQKMFTEVIVRDFSDLFTTKISLSVCDKAVATKLPLRTSRTFTTLSDRAELSV